jgi:putative aldouronate transport system substrate-binding protein
VAIQDPVIEESQDERTGLKRMGLHQHRAPGSELSRRRLIRVAVGGACALSASLLAVACQPASAPSLAPGGAAPTTSAPAPATSAPAPAPTSVAASGAPVSSASTSHVPTFAPAQGPPPDYPGTASGVDPGFVKFPAQLSQTVHETPAASGSVTGMVLVANPSLPAPVDNNPAWQQLNKALGTSLIVNMVPQPDYASRWGTVTAGGDLPDVMYVSIVPVLPNIQAFQKSLCSELTPYLGGDAVKDYVNLANINAASWRIAMLDGAVWGVPVPRSVTGWPMYVQQNLLDQIGAGPPKTIDDFTAICKQLTRPDANKWALGVTNDSTSGPYSMLWFQGVFRAPNNWRMDVGGKLTKDIETDEYRAALEYVHSLISSGYISPDVKANGDLHNDFMSGKIAMRSNAWNAYSGLYIELAPQFNINIRTIPPFGFDGREATNLLGPGNFGYAVLKQASADRVKEILRVLNYLAAPFGSQEYMVSKFGIKDADYTFNDKGSPVFTDQGHVDMPNSPNLPWGYMATAPTVTFSVNQPDWGDWGHAEQQRLIDVGVADPTYGKYSPTAATKGVVLDQLIFDRVSGIAAGRAPMSDLDQLTKDWRAQGGDVIRDELQQALQTG